MARLPSIIRGTTDHSNKMPLQFSKNPQEVWQMGVEEHTFDEDGADIFGTVWRKGRFCGAEGN